MNDRSKGLALAALGGIALTFDIPLIRLTEGDIWSVQFVRGLMIAPIGIAVWAFLRLSGRYREPLLPGRLALPVALFYGASSALFFVGVFNTSTANLVFILAFNPMIAALMGWIFLKEKPAPQTFAAMAVMILGVFIIVREGLNSGHWIGDAAALGSCFSIAAAITFSRISKRNHGFTVMISQLVPVVIALPHILAQGVNIPVPLYMGLNGGLFLPLAFFCLAAAPRFIGAAESAMFYLLETVFAPIWVYFIFAEVPTANALTGGAILLAALVAHTVWELNRARFADPA
jgi:drug/metabolite transporter (DMT)-like permease